MDPSPVPDAPLPSPGSAPPRRRTRRRRLLALAAAAGLGLAWVAAHEWANTGSTRERIRAGAEETLRRRLGAVEVGEAHVDWIGRAIVGPVVVPAARPGSSPVLRAERVVVRPSLTGLLAGRIEPASVRLLRVRLVPGPGGSELRDLVARLRAARPGGLGPGASGGRRGVPAIRFRDLHVSLERGGRPVDVGPLGADLELEPGAAGEATVLRGRVLLPGGGRVDVEARRDGDAARIRAELAASFPGDLPAAIARRLPAALADGRLEGSLELSGDPDLRSGTGRLDLRLRDVFLSGRRVGPEPLGPFAGAARGSLRWDLRAGTASLADGRLELGAGEAAAAAAASIRSGADPRLAVELAVDRLPWRDLLAALPAALRPPEAVPEPAGTLSARFRIEGPPSRPAEWRVEGDLDLEDMRRAARAGPRSWLLSPFRGRPVDPAPDEVPRDIEVGPANPLFVPLAELPPWLPRAVTAAEDAGFWAHRGFDVQEIAEALRRGGTGRLRGASTITQQLAKNLFLSPERTLSRKVREALATVALEATVPKARLLEIYLNLAEWGPGVYGVGEAATFWLGKDARDLTPKEAAFLASVIPSPRRFHARLLRGGVSGAWAERVADLLSKMWLQGQLSDEQLLRALDEPLALVPGPGAAATEPAGSAVEEEPAAAGDAEPGAEPDPAFAPEGEPAPEAAPAPPPARDAGPPARPGGPAAPTPPR
jgi:penicillin-binding protein 1A